MKSITNALPKFDGGGGTILPEGIIEIRSGKVGESSTELVETLSSPLEDGWYIISVVGYDNSTTTYARNRSIAKAPPISYSIANFYGIGVLQVGTSSTPNPFFFEINKNVSSMSDKWEIHYGISTNNEFKIHIDFKTSTTGYNLSDMPYTMVISKYAKLA